MKKLALSALFISSLFTANLASAQSVAAVANVNKNTKVAKGTSYTVDAAQSNMTWDGKKVTGQHNGTVKIANGTVLVNKNKLVGGTVNVDMNSIVSLDLTDAGYNQKLIGHLKSDDFFSVEKHPNATFKINSATPIKGAKAGAPNYNVGGNLTIKGITQPVSFPATVTVNGNTISAKSEAITLDRTKWDIRYGSKTFFASIGDKAIMDDFTVKFNVVAKK